MKICLDDSSQADVKYTESKDRTKRKDRHRKRTLLPGEDTSEEDANKKRKYDKKGVNGLTQELEKQLPAAPRTQTLVSKSNSKGWFDRLKQTKIEFFL